MPGSESQPPDPIPAPASAPPRRGGRWKKVLLLVLLGGMVLLGALAALLPTILSSDFARAEAEAEISAAAGMRVGLGGLSVDWSRTEVRDLVVRWGPGEDDPVLARVGTVRVPAGIAAAFADRYDLALVEILRPEIRVDLRELTRPAAPAAAAAVASAAGGGGPGIPGSPSPGADAVPPFTVKVAVREGTLVLVGLDGKEARLGSFSADLSASSVGPAEVFLDLDLGPSGKARFRAKASPFQGGRPVAAEALEAVAEATLEALDLAPFREAACALGGLGIDELMGSATGTVSLRAVEGGAGVEDGRASLALAGLVLSGPELGAGARIEEPEVRFEGGFRAGKDGGLDLRDCLLRARGVEAKASVGMAADGAVHGSVLATASLEELVPRAKRFGVPFEGFAAGEATIEVRALSEGKARRFSGTLGLRDVQISAGRGSGTVDEPQAHAEFDVTQEGGNWTIGSLTLRSGTAGLGLTGTAAEDGSAADLHATAKVRLERAVRVLRAFGAAPPGEIAGAADLDVRFRRSAGASGKDEAKGTLVVTDLAVTPPGAGAKTVREPRLEAVFEAIPGEDRLELKSFRLQGAGADLSFAGSVVKGGESGTLDPMEVNLDLEKAAALADAFGAALPVKAAGAAAWKGVVSWIETGNEVAADGGLELRGLAVTLPAEGALPERTLREDTVVVSLNATATAAPGGAGYSIALRRGALKAKGLDATAAGSAGADGTVELAAAGTLSIPEALRRAVELKALEKDPATRGTLEFDLAVRGKPGDAALTVNRLEAKDAEFGLRASGRLATKGAGDLSLEAGGELGTLLDLAARAGFLEPVKGAAGKAAVRLTAKASGAVDPLLVSLDGGLEGLRYPDPAGGAPWTQKALGAKGDFTVDRRALAVGGTAVLTADDGTVTVKGTADLAEGKRAFEAAADLDVDAGGVFRARPDLRPLEVWTVGKVKGTLTVKGPLADPFDFRALTGTAKVVLDSVKTEPFELRDAALDAVLQGGTVAARSIAATVNGGKVTGAASLGLQGAEGKHFVDVAVEGARIDPAMAFILKQVVPVFAVAEAGGVTGALRLSLRLDAEGADWAAAQKTLRGKGALTVFDGSVSGSGILGEVLEFLGGGGKGLGFSAITTEFVVHDERVWNERLTVDGKEHAMVLSGSTAFDGRIDYSVGAKSLKMGKKRLEKLKPLMDEDGNLPFRLSGTLSRPKVKGPDLKKLLGNVAEDLLKKKLKDLLGGDE